MKHLTTGEEGAVRADETFNSASVIKIPVAVQALEMVDAKRLELAERLTLTAGDVRGGSGIFRYHDAGLQPTMRDVLLQMIITSDNTATDLAIAQVGGVASVNALAGHGRLRRRHEAHADDRRPLRQVQRADAGRRPQRQDQRRHAPTGWAS